MSAEVLRPRNVTAGCFGICTFRLYFSVNSIHTHTLIFTNRNVTIQYRFFFVVLGIEPGALHTVDMHTFL